MHFQPSRVPKSYKFRQHQVHPRGEHLKIFQINLTWSIVFTILFFPSLSETGLSHFSGRQRLGCRRIGPVSSDNVADILLCRLRRSRKLLLLLRCLMDLHSQPLAGGPRIVLRWYQGRANGIFGRVRSSDEPNQNRV
jgi:hypothetical protein